MQVEKFTFFGSFYEAMNLLPEERRCEFVMGLLAYAFEGVEPSFDGGLAAMFALAKPNIDSSVKGVRNGGKGGRPKSDKTQSETTQENPVENPPAKPPAKTNKELDMDRKEDGDVDKNGEGNFSLEKNSPPPVASDGAAVGEPTPPAAPKCPMCGSEVERTGMPDPDFWWCPSCRDNFPEGKALP